MNSYITTTQSARVPDVNLWDEISGNPLTKAGVFQYSGRQIHSSLDPNKLYNVLRPPEELQDEACIESFKLIPLIDDHAMLGHKRGNMPADSKGVQGVVGEEVYYEHPYLKGNIKIYGKKIEDKINAGKKDLSAGYHCLFKLQKGVYNGVTYDAVQYRIRGNHVALVEEGRSGPDVSVLDEAQFIYDSVEIIAMNENEEKKETKDEEPSIKSLDAAIKAMDSRTQAMATALDAIAGVVSKLAKDESEEKKETEDEEEEKKKAEDEDKEEEKKAAKDEEPAKKEAKDAEYCASKTMDAAVKKAIPQIMDSLRADESKKSELVRKLLPHVGVFDSAPMSLDQVATYALDKLKLTARAGHELSVLDGYLAGKRIPTPTKTTAMDSKGRTSQIDNYINGGV